MRWRARRRAATPARSNRGRTHRRSGGREERNLTAAGTALRCAALLRGGVHRTRVFEVLAVESDDARQIQERVSMGVSARDAIACQGAEWRVLAAAWALSEESGAALAPALERIAAALREIQRVRERRSVLLAGPRATVRLVSVLPALALAMGGLLGFNPLPVLVSGAGAALTVIGVALLASGVLWARWLTRIVEREDRVAGLELELVWIGLGGGAPPRTAALRAADCVDRLRVEWVRLDAFCADGALAQTFRRAELIGVPIRPLLLEEATAARGRELAEIERAAERLGVRVLIPLGVCVLPAFITLGVLPVVISMFGGGLL